MIRRRPGSSGLRAQEPFAHAKRTVPDGARVRLRRQRQDLPEKIRHFSERHQRRELRGQVPQFWRDRIFAGEQHGDGLLAA